MIPAKPLSKLLFDALSGQIVCHQPDGPDNGEVTNSVISR